MDIFHDFLLEIAGVIGYEGDKEAFANKFAATVLLESYSTLVESLPDEKKQVVKAELSKLQVPNEIDALMKENFTETELKQAVEQSSKKMMQEFMDTIKPSLTEEQKKQLAVVATKYAKTTPATTPAS